jgi:hypothetical protein
MNLPGVDTYVCDASATNTRLPNLPPCQMDAESRLLAHSGSSRRCINSVAIGGEADISILPSQPFHHHTI